jgi:hypothetical protein
MAAYDRKDGQARDGLDRAEKWYDAACCHAQAGQLDPAFASLQRAIDGGFRDAAHLERDTDLASLHADPRWQSARASLAEKLVAYRASINGELLDLFSADQGDRVGTIDWSVVNPRDEARRKRVDEILTAGGAKVADDFYHAAMVYQHGSTPAEILRARDLALKAVALDATHARAKWLAAAAEDRVLMRASRRSTARSSRRSRARGCCGGRPGGDRRGTREVERRRSPPRSARRADERHA